MADDGLTAAEAVEVAGTLFTVRRRISRRRNGIAALTAADAFELEAAVKEFEARLKEDGGEVAARDGFGTLALNLRSLLKAIDGRYALGGKL
jgi:hypothetical protein